MCLAPNEREVVTAANEEVNSKSIWTRMVFGLTGIGSPVGRARQQMDHTYEYMYERERATESSGAQQRVPAEDLLPAVALHLIPVLLLVRTARLRSYARASHSTHANSHSRTNAEATATAPNAG